MSIGLPDYGRTFLVRIHVVARGMSPGAITAISVAAGGTGYAPGDTFSFPGGDNNGEAEVDTVGGGGEILTLHITAGGLQYGAALRQGVSNIIGTGVDAEINIDAVSRDPEDKAWDFTGLLCGSVADEAYTWVGSPVPAVVAAMPGTETWDFAVVVDGTDLNPTVTGEADKSIRWTVTVELDEAVS